MKYVKRLSVILILVVLCLANSREAKAADVEGLKEVWYETRYYPVNPESDEWMEYGLEDTLDILNPPEELLHSFSTEELAELMMDYPFLWMLTSYEYDKMDYFFDFIEYNCDIYNELMSREDGVSCLLKEYQKSDFNVNLYNEDPYMVWGYHPMANAEVFGCQFIVYMNNSSDIDEEEAELYSQVMRDKTESYLALHDNIAKEYLSFGKKQSNSYSVAESMLSNEAENLAMRASDGFTATGEAYSRKTEGVDIYYVPGTYQKYGVSASCLQWYSGDYDEETKKKLDNKIAYEWDRISRSSPKYNCHSYAWLNANVSNGYWLASPAEYMNSSEVTHVGYNVTPQVGDIIVMYNRKSGAIAHSAVIRQTPSGSTGTYTVSKIGGCGLYIAPLSELKSYYSCDNYDVYRKN